MFNPLVVIALLVAFATLVGPRLDRGAGSTIAERFRSVHGRPFLFTRGDEATGDQLGRVSFHGVRALLTSSDVGALALANGPQTVAAPAAGGATAAGGNNGAPSAPPAILVPFTRASSEHVEPMDDRQKLLVVGQNFPQQSIDVPPVGWLRAIVLDVILTGGAGGGAVVKQDGPFSVLQNISLQDVGGSYIQDPVNGFELYLENKYGAYQGWMNDAKLLPSYSALDANGNGSFKLRIPVEVSGRDALGSLPNQDSSQTYKLNFTFADPSLLFTTNPAGALPTVRVRTHIETWTQPPKINSFNQPNQEAPPAAGTVQRWTRVEQNINAGDQTVKVPRVGNLIRNIIMTFRLTSTGLRDDVNFPDPFRFVVDNRDLYATTQRIRKDRIGEVHGFAADTGVYVFNFAHDLDGQAGFELRDQWLPTTQGTKLALLGTFGAAGVVSMLVNDVQVAGDPQQVFEVI